MIRKKDILIVDGYNMIGAWPHLQALMKTDKLEQARDALLFELSNFKKIKGYDQIIVVFDAHLVPGLMQRYDEFELSVVFTKEGETADQYIEREIARYVSLTTRVEVATSDATEQWVIFQRGALRKSANELAIDIAQHKQVLAQEIDARIAKVMRFKSPWDVEQLTKLEQLRKDLELD